MILNIVAGILSLIFGIVMCIQGYFIFNLFTNITDEHLSTLSVRWRRILRYLFWIVIFLVGLGISTIFKIKFIKDILFTIFSIVIYVYIFYKLYKLPNIGDDGLDKISSIEYEKTVSIIQAMCLLLIGMVIGKFVLSILNFIPGIIVIIITGIILAIQSFSCFIIYWKSDQIKIWFRNMLLITTAIGAIIAIGGVISIIASEGVVMKL